MNKITNAIQFATKRAKLFLLDTYENGLRLLIGKPCCQCGKALLPDEQRHVRVTFGYAVFCAKCKAELNKFDTKVSYRR